MQIINKFAYFKLEFHTCDVMANGGHGFCPIHRSVEMAKKRSQLAKAAIEKTHRYTTEKEDFLDDELDRFFIMWLVREGGCSVCRFVTG